MGFFCQNLNISFPPEHLEDEEDPEGEVVPNYQLQQEVVEELGDSDRQSNLSGISQQDRDNKTILLRQAASGKDIYSHMPNSRECSLNYF